MPHPDPAPTALRLRAPLLIVALEFAVIAGVNVYASTMFQNVLGLGIAPVAAAIALGVWWLRAAALPRHDRLAGIALAAASLAVTALAQPQLGYGLLAYSVPVTTTALVAAIAATAPLPWRARRTVLVMVLAACTALFGALRVDSIGGDLYPVLAWRWSPAEGDRAAAIPRADPHDTATLPAAAGPGDWPAFRGPARDGRAEGVRFATDWSAAPPRELWRRPVGPGWSSMAVVGEYLFTQEQAGDDELVACYHAGAGAPVWVNRNAARFEDPMGQGPRATPAYDRGRLFAIGGNGLLQCLDAATGAVLWHRNLADGGKPPMYAFASSPLVADGLVLAYTCGAGRRALIAFDAATGDERWTAAGESHAYSSPQLSNVAGVPQVLMYATFGLQALDPGTGALLWQHDWPYTTYDRCTQPGLAGGGRILMGTTGEMGSRLIEVSRNGEAWQTAEVWSTRKQRPYFNDGVIHEGFHYGFDGNRLNCIDLANGERRWQGERYSGQVLLAADPGVLIVLSEDGEIVLVKASPEAFAELARVPALEGKTWNHPVIAHGRLYVRNGNEMAAYELPAA